MIRLRRSGQHLPISSYLEGRAIKNPRAAELISYLNPRSSKRTVPKTIAFFTAIILTIGGVTASVAITLRGNSSTQDGIVSLGVGQAAADSCNKTTTVKTDTISQWDDTYGDFTLQRVNVTGVVSSCQNHVLTLVLNMSSGPDFNVACSLPASASFTYEQSTFVFTTSAYSAPAGQYSCGTFSPYPMYMASISAAAVQIK